MSTIIKGKNICKSFGKIDAVKNVDLNIQSGKFYVIKGHSGSGKSTLLSIIGLLDSATKGEIQIEDQNVLELSEKEKAFLRMSKLGFVFQDFFLNETMRAYENVMVPMMINPILKEQDLKQRACNLLETLGLKERVEHYPKEMSGGEKQRVAICRALANAPKCILADEPTGNLDKANEKVILEVLRNIVDCGKTVIVVTHSDEVIQYADHVFLMDGGFLNLEGTI